MRSMKPGCSPIRSSRRAVPPGRSLIRTSYMATHTEEDLDQALAIFEKVGKKMGVIP